MRFKLFAVIFAGFCSIVTASFCTGAAQTDTARTVSKYNYRDAFAPFFYSKNGNEYRAADGQPGPKYWQNRADYQLSATLNDATNEITGSETLTYTNNSPQKLDFLWMQVRTESFQTRFKGNCYCAIVRQP